MTTPPLMLQWPQGMGDLVVRPATAADRPALVEVLSASWGGYGIGLHDELTLELRPR